MHDITLLFSFLLFSENEDKPGDCVRCVLTFTDAWQYCYGHKVNVVIIQPVNPVKC